MAQYVFTSALFSGYMKFAYDDEDILIKFENNAKLDDSQLAFLTRNFPFTLQDLPRIQGSKGKFEEDVDITFDNFWKCYNYKKGKMDAQIQFNKLTDKEKFKAIAYIPKFIYDTKIKGHDMLYAERYLKKRRFDDE